MKQSRAQLDTARVNLHYTTILSPVNGTVISRNVDAGQTVAASFQTPVLFLVAKDLTKMQVDTNVSESDIGGITEGKPATFVVDAYPNQVFQGKVIQVRNAPITVQNVVTYNVVIGVDNTDLRLKPGMTANVSIIIASREDILKIPNQALRFKPGLTKSGDRAGGLPTAASGKREEGGKDGSPGGGGREATGEKSKPTVWIRSPQGEPTPLEIKAGITDGTYTELIEGALKGALKGGDEVITGLEMPRGPHGAGPGGSLPPGFGSQPSQRPRTSTPRGM